jgi:nitroreductase
MDLDKAIKNRHSVKKFKSKKPDWRDIIECLDAARYAPMAGGNYSLKFILVSDEDKIQQMAEASQQPFISKARYVVVFCSNPSRTINAYGERGRIYSRQQAGAAMQNFLLKLEEAGLSTTWVGHFVEEQIKSILEIPEHVQVEAIFPIGYEFEKKYTRKEKTDMDNVLYFDEWENDQMKTPKETSD